MENAKNKIINAKRTVIQKIKENKRMITINLFFIAADIVCLHHYYTKIKS